MPTHHPIGLLGGTFDPIHYGHLRVALEVQQTLGLESVHLLPCHRPPHRLPPVASAQDRLNMLALALEQCPKLILDAREMQRDTPSYTVDTLKDFRKEMGGARPLCLIIGREVFNDLPSWHEPAALLELAHIIVTDRPMAVATPSNLAPFLAHQTDDIKDITQKPHGHVYFQPISQLEISATHIRSLLKAHKSPQFLLPDRVLAYIIGHQLYT